MIGPEILVPVLFVVLVVPTVLVIANRRLRASRPVTSSAPRAAPLTAAALHRLPTPPWRVVHDIATERLGGVEQVLIGPPGVFAITSALESTPTDSDPSPFLLAETAARRGAVDDLLTGTEVRCEADLRVHWGRTDHREPVTEVTTGAIALDGHRLAIWAEEMLATPDRLMLSPEQVDAAWRAVIVGIGRPDPLPDR